MKWDAALMKERCKILLLVDDYTVHPALDTLHNICLDFLPADTTSLIQPMDLGVIQKLKNHYRKELMQMTGVAIEDSLVCTTSTAIVS